VGTLLGVGVTALYAYSRGWPTLVPAWAMGAGLVATLLVGAVAGLHPAVRASRLAPDGGVRRRLIFGDGWESLGHVADGGSAEDLLYLLDGPPKPRHRPVVRKQRAG
jgi:hypothetical protein